MRQGIAILAALLLAATVLWIVGCEDDDVTNGGEEFNSIALQPVRLPTLKAGLVYEGWVVELDEDSNWVDFQSFGKFFWDEFDYFFYSPNDTTQRIDSVFTISGDVYSYEMIAVTLEPHPVDNSPDPSPTVVAVDAINRSEFSVLKFPADFSEGAGQFAVGTFSDGHYQETGDPISNEFSGIWFIELIKNTIGDDIVETMNPGLSLPALPDTGYTYEGWVLLDNGDTLSTGKFLFPEFQDYDNRYMAAGAIPNYPGEDFLQNAPPGLDFPISLLEGGTSIISIEPNPDNDLSRPSNLIVLRGSLPVVTGVVRAGSYPMANVAAVQFPTVNVFFMRGS
jgi:hypothetical protein